MGKRLGRFTVTSQSVELDQILRRTDLCSQHPQPLTVAELAWHEGGT
jgi:hypothetical protein